MQAAEERHAAAVNALKQGWAAELKRQAANWEAAAAAKQEAWRSAKVAEIKEQTVKVQRGVFSGATCIGLPGMAKSAVMYSLPASMAGHLLILTVTTASHLL